MKPPNDQRRAHISACAQACNTSRPLNRVASELGESNQPSDTPDFFIFDHMKAIRSPSRYAQLSPTSNTNIEIAALCNDQSPARATAIFVIATIAAANARAGARNQNPRSNPATLIASSAQSTTMPPMKRCHESRVA